MGDERSAACPWLPRATALDGSYPGDVGFDPFFLSSIQKDFSGFIQPPAWEDKGSTLPTIYWMREAELKHGRVAMLAVVGWLTTDAGIRIPGKFFADIPSSYNAHDILVDRGIMTFMLLAVGFAEFCFSSVLVQASKGETDRPAGDYQLGAWALNGMSDEEIFDMKTKEVQNGRLAMLAFGGIATQTAMGATEFPYF